MIVGIKMFLQLKTQRLWSLIAMMMIVIVQHYDKKANYFDSKEFILR